MTAPSNEPLQSLRADARKNFERLLAVARIAVTKDGADASLREIARKAGVGLGTFYRHFPTREALLETLLRTAWDELVEKGRSLESANDPDEALMSWLRDFIVVVRTYRGVVAAMMSALDDKDSALHASCVKMRAAGAKLLERGQAEGTARSDIDGTDLVALAAALAWIGDQPVLEARAEHLFGVVMDAVFNRSAGGARADAYVRS